jgi:hypothetical protein
MVGNCASSGVLTRIESDPSRRKHNVSDSGIRTRVSCDSEVMMFVDLSQSIYLFWFLVFQKRTLVDVSRMSAMGQKRT